MSQPAQEQDVPYPFISPIIAGVVFLGGCVGTGVRYALSPLPVLGASSQTTPGSFHLGTFIANMIACFCYAALVSYLAQAPWIPARRRELVSRSCGMGICGACRPCPPWLLRCSSPCMRAVCSGRCCTSCSPLPVASSSRSSA